MALKEVVQVFQTISSQSISGSAVVVSSVSAIGYMDNVGLQYMWTGSPVGTFNVQGSLDYRSGRPQSQGGGSPQPGTWNTITLTAIVDTSSGSSALINIQGAAWPYIRTLYAQSSGSGVLSAYVYAKSTGS